MTEQIDKQPSAIKIILVGQLIINRPVTIAIIASAILFAQFGIGWSLSIILGTGVGWFVWSKQLDRWKLWALNNGVERERLYKLGKIGLLNFYRYRIFDNEETSKERQDDIHSDRQ